LRYSTLHLVRIRQSTKETTKKQPEGRSSRAFTVRAAVEASDLLRSVKKLRRECDEIEKEEVSCVRRGCV
jgi:hypothetical protein